MSDVSSAVLYLQQIGFCQVASAAALLYDYLLAFDSEVDLIWAKEWNLVTLLYVIVRYLSFFLILDYMFYVGNLTWSPNVSLVWYQIHTWGPYVFRVAMDIIMMKRVHALSCQCTLSGFLNQPKWVLRIMVIACIAKYAASITMLLLATGPSGHLTSLEASFSGVHVCGTMIPLATLLISSQFPTLAFEALLFVLAFGYFVADVSERWGSKEPRMWKVSDLVQILVRDNTIYFAIIVAATALDVANYKVSGLGLYLAMSMALQIFLPFCFAPRLVINMKKHKNRVHMSGLGGGFDDMASNGGLGHLPQGIQQVEEDVA